MFQDSSWLTYVVAAMVAINGAHIVEMACVSRTSARDQLSGNAIWQRTLIAAQC